MSLSQKKQGLFDYIYCCEVLEHLTAEDLAIAIENILSVLSPSGTVIVTVPIESGFPVIVKGLVRRQLNKELRQEYNWTNIYHSFMRHPLPEARSGKDYLSHLGFYYQDLELLHKQHFIINKKWVMRKSPWKGLTKIS